MERRKDKNNHVLKDGESYHEKEHRYMYRWVDSDKKRHCTYAQTLRELRKKEAEINRNKSDGISSAGSNLRLDDVYNLWKKNKVGLKQSTYVNYLYMYEHFIGPKIGKMKIKDIRKSTVLGLYNDLTRSNDIGKTMAINTLEVIHNVSAILLHRRGRYLFGSGRNNVPYHTHLGHFPRSVCRNIRRPDKLTLG